MTIDEAYRELELEPGASREEIKRAYKDLSVVWHPDKFANSDRLREKAHEKLKRINTAYETLTANGSAPEAAGEDGSVYTGEYIDEQCRYLGGDPRLRSVSLIELKGRRCTLTLGPEGIKCDTQGSDGVQDVATYPAKDIIALVSSGKEYVPPTASPNVTPHDVEITTNPSEVTLIAQDPEGVVANGFRIRLSFRSPYFQGVFAKRAVQAFHLVPPTKKKSPTPKKSTPTPKTTDQASIAVPSHIRSESRCISILVHFRDPPHSGAFAGSRSLSADPCCRPRKSRFRFWRPGFRDTFTLPSVARKTAL
jgi:hypothetical protein